MSDRIQRTKLEEIHVGPSATHAGDVCITIQTGIAVPLDPVDRFTTYRLAPDVAEFLAAQLYATLLDHYRK